MWWLSLSLFDGIGFPAYWQVLEAELALGGFQCSIRDCPGHQLAQLARAIQASTSRIWTKALRNCLDPRILGAIDPLAYMSSYPRKAAWVG
jgi:hypothetical protein